MNSKDMVKQVLLEVFENYAWDDGVDRTAERIIAAWKEFVPPMQPDFDFTTFPATANQMIVVKDIEFSSLCAHHLFPYTGRAHVGYLPNDLMVGVSKIPRLVRYFATRPTTQEWLTAQIASTMKHKLQAMGVAVVVEAVHTCMACRGVRAYGSTMVTSEMRGVFLTSSEARLEFLNLIGRKGG